MAPDLEDVPAGPRGWAAGRPLSGSLCRRHVWLPHKLLAAQPVLGVLGKGLQLAHLRPEQPVQCTPGTPGALSAEVALDPVETDRVSLIPPAWVCEGEGTEPTYSSWFIV